MRTGLIGFCALHVRFRCVDVFLSIAILVHLKICLGLFDRRAGLRDLLRSIASHRLFRGSTRLLERCDQFLVVKGDQNLAGFHPVSLANQNFVDSPGDLGAHANIVRFHCAGALQSGIVPQPTRSIGRYGENARDQEDEEEAFAIHKNYSLALGDEMEVLATTERGARPDHSTLNALSIRECKLASP